MKIRCNNCYRILNQNEEYCTSCGEYSAKMHNAMITGNYGPDNLGKFKIGFGIFAIAGFLVCGILQVVFSIIESDETGLRTNLYSQTNSLFLSSLCAILFCLILFRKDLKSLWTPQKKENILGVTLIGVFVILICILLSYLFNFTQIFPKFTKDYLDYEGNIFFDVKDTCVSKILFGTIVSSVVLEIACRKFLIDALDDTLLGDKAIYIITVIVMTVFEIAWVMSLDILVVSIIVNIATTGIYMNTNRNVIYNILLRIVLYLVAGLLLIL